LRSLKFDDVNGTPNWLPKPKIFSGSPGAILIVARGAISTTTPDRFTQANPLHQKPALQKWE
jgi:hypothetical protein